MRLSSPFLSPWLLPLPLLGRTSPQSTCPIIAPAHLTLLAYQTLRYFSSYQLNVFDLVFPIVVEECLLWVAVVLFRHIE